MPNPYRNPWLRDMVQIARESGLEYGQADVDACRNHAPEKCDCGQLRYWKPTVGTYVCPSCGKVKTRA